MTNSLAVKTGIDPLKSEKTSGDVPAKPTKIDSTPVIVGIGASAGGLEALEQFFTPIPANCGAAFVVIQHLDPTHKGILPELLQRVTLMMVSQAVDRVIVKPNCVYVIPPNKDLTILHGQLHLLDPIPPRGLRLPIDLFFRALAEDQHERAIGVILSGMGADGTLGIIAIKENSGLALAQSTGSAQFDAMPRSVIDAGLADIIASPLELWPRISTYLENGSAGLHVLPKPDMELKSQSALEQIVALLRERSCNDFSLYKKNTIYRRIERRMDLHKIHVIANYVLYLRGNSQELDLLFKELLIGVTHFFRDPAVWEKLKTETIPALLIEFPKGKALRAWVAACSTGEEAYSLAIIFKEVLAQTQTQPPFTLQIFATDLDQDAIEFARQGFYPASIAGAVSAERLSNFFTADGKGYRINKDIREMVLFARQNVIMDPPFTKLDILCCRNLLIYLSPELQAKLIPLFHFALINRGYLLLGNSETISGFSHLFNALDNNARLYQRIGLPFSANLDNVNDNFPTAALAQAANSKVPAITNLQTMADQLLLQHYAPAAVLVNIDGDILYISGRTGKYLEPAAGKANWNIHAMAREGLRYDLVNALKKAQNQTEPVHLTSLMVTTDCGSCQAVNLVVQAITKPSALSDMIIVVFTDVPAQAAGKVNRSKNVVKKAWQDELRQAQEQLETLQADMQASQENLQTANEDLQSSNEELTTSKEEMQSLNEELQTVNEELQTKVDDLSRVSNDMNHLLNSMEIATVFLDKSLNIRRFTSHTTHLFKLIAVDVGRPLSDIVTDLDYPQLQQDAQEVQRSLIVIEKQIKAGDERWFKVRIMPYRTQHNVIDGVVITFIDISETKKLEAKLRITHDKAV
jgi:chemotaxis protein methyltransferase CheR/two-component system CheB/CheR fusion protein